VEFGRGEHGRAVILAKAGIHEFFYFWFLLPQERQTKRGKPNELLLTPYFQAGVGCPEEV